MKRKSVAVLLGVVIFIGTIAILRLLSKQNDDYDAGGDFDDDEDEFIDEEFEKQLDAEDEYEKQVTQCCGRVVRKEEKRELEL